MRNVEKKEPLDDAPVGRIPVTPAEEMTVHVASECQAIFRIVTPNDAPSDPLGSALFHVPPFPSVDAIDPSVKLYEKRDEVDADLMEMLLCLDWKMNLLIKIFSPVRDAEVYPYRAVITAISMQDITIRTTQALEMGTLLEFHFVLPVLPFRELFLRGTVAAASPDPPGEYEISITLSHWSESDREHLIRYIVKRQFQLKRHQKEGAPQRREAGQSLRSPERVDSGQSVA